MFGFIFSLLVVGGLGTLVAIGDPQNARDLLDCTGPEGRVILWDPNVHEPGSPPREAMRPESPSVARWLSDWAAGVDLWEAMFPSGTDGAA